MCLLFFIELTRTARPRVFVIWSLFHSVDSGAIDIAMNSLSKSEIKTFGFIGLGLMGKPMAANLAASLAEDQKMFVYDLVDSAVVETCDSAPGRVLRGMSPKDVAEKAVSLHAALVLLYLC